MLAMVKLVYETDAEMIALQSLLDTSARSAGAHLRSIFGREHLLSARQVCTHLQGVKQVAAATVNSKGEPRVAPIDAVFFHGRFNLSTDLKSLRARHLLKRPSVSVTYFEEADPVVLVHGKAVFLRGEEPDFALLDSEWKRSYGRSVTELSDTVTFIRVEPSIMLAYSFRPQRFPEK